MVRSTWLERAGLDLVSPQGTDVGGGASDMAAGGWFGSVWFSVFL